MVHAVDVLVAVALVMVAYVAVVGAVAVVAQVRLWWWRRKWGHR